MTVLFLHGAGGLIDDQPMVDALRRGLDAEVAMPALGEEDMSHRAWSDRILAHLGPDIDVVVGHSFGGSTVLKLLTERDLGVQRLVLLAVPDWGTHGWDVPEYALPGDAQTVLPQGLEIELHHCLDDEVVPFRHLGLLAARLPRASVYYRRQGGHQFTAPAITAVVRRILGPRSVDDPGPFFHGTKAPLKPGDLLRPGRASNYGARRRANFTYLSATLDAAIWGAELATGDLPGRIYQVEPTGTLEDDPNLTDQRFEGNPTRSYRTRDPVRVVTEIAGWEPHPPETLQQMRQGLADLEQLGIEAINH